MEVFAFTLFMQAYDEVRAAVKYLRRKEGDAEEIASSVYGGRSNGKRKEDGAAPTVVTPSVPAVVATAKTTAAPEVPVGHMGGSPFSS